jgi:iron complex outermembrane receptor protein
MKRQNNALEQVDATARLATDLPGRRLLVATASGVRREQGIPGVCCQSTLDAHLGFDRASGQLAYVSRDDLGPGGRLEARVYGLFAEQRLRDLLHEVLGRPTNTRDQTTSYGASARGSVLVGELGRLTAITDGRYETYSPFDAETKFPAGAPATRATGAAGAEAELWAHAIGLVVLPSVRVELARDAVSTRDAFTQAPITSPATTDVLPVLRLGAIERPTDAFAIRANVGRYRRLPSTFERYGNTGVVLPNPSLRPETAVNADAGVAVTIGDATNERRRLVLDAGVFGSWADDLIGLEVVERGKAVALNVGRARITGVELSVTGGWRFARIFAQATYTNARDDSDDEARRGRALPLRPRVRGYARPELRFATRADSVRFGVYGDADYTAGYFADPANLVELPARLLVGSGGFVEEPATGLRLTVSAQNLGDVRAFDFVGFPLPGRSAFVTLAWSLPERNVSSP